MRDEVQTLTCRDETIVLIKAIIIVKGWITMLRKASVARVNRRLRRYYLIVLFFFVLFFNLTYSRWTSYITILPVVTKDLFISPRFTPYDFLSRCKFSTLTTRQPMVEFYLLASPRFPLRKKEHKSYFGKNRTHDFRTSRCARYLLDHSGDDLPNMLTLACLLLSSIKYDTGHLMMV